MINFGFRYIIVLAFASSFLLSCGSTTDVYNTPTYSNKGILNAVIEIPAGTNIKIEYNPSSKKFEPDQRNGKDRVIDFLPYPANYGFIPSTFSDPDNGGDGDALDIVVICGALKTGIVVEVIPVGMLNLIDSGEIDSKILAVPSNPKIRTINALSLEDIRTSYPKIEEILVTWFLNYDMRDDTQINGVSDAQTAIEEIKRNLKY